MRIISLRRVSSFVTATALLGACNSDDGAADTLAPETIAETTTAGDTAPADTELNDTSGTQTATAETAPAETQAETVDTSPLGGARPANVTLPSAYDAAQAWPLVILLHGYSASGEVQDAYMQFSANAATAGYIAVVPEGTQDGTGARFWNSDPAWCCNFGHSTVDDRAYLSGLIDEAKARYHVDPARVYFVGHSNGGFMSYRMACDFADRVAAIVSIAGSLPLEATDCAPSEPVSLLQVHGTADATIPYLGMIGQYPGAATITDRWGTYDHCPSAAAAGAETRDYDSVIFGNETVTEARTGCARSSEVALWTLNGSGHIPGFTPAFMPDVFAWLSAHPKAAPTP